MAILIYLLFFSFFLLPFQLFAISTYGVTLFDFVLLFFYFKVLYDFLRGRIVVKVDKISLTIFLSLLFAVFISGISPLLSGEKELIIQYFKTTLHFIFLILLPITVCLIKIDNKIWENSIKIWLVVGFIINIFGIYQIVARAYDLPFAWIQLTNISLTGRGLLFGEDEIAQLSLAFGNFFRATSIFSEPSALAGFNMSLLIFLVVPIIQRRKGFFKNKKITYTFAIVSVVTLFLTFSLTGLVSFFLLLFFVFVLEKFNRVLKFAVMSAMILVVVLGVTDKLISHYAEVSVVDLFGMRLEGIIYRGEKERDFIGGESFGSRMETFEKSYQIWQKSPIIGVGMGLTAYQKLDIVFADASIMQVLSETGLIGAILYLALFVSLFVRSLKLKKSIDHLSLNRADNSSEFLLESLIIYVVIFHFFINYFTGNTFVTCASWLPLSIVFSVLNNSQEMLYHLSIKAS